MGFDSSAIHRAGWPNADPEVGAAGEAPRHDPANSLGLFRLPKKRKRRANIAVWAAMVDLLCIGLAFTVSSYFRLGFLDMDQISRILVTVLPIYLVAALNSQALQVTVLLDGFRSLWKASAAFFFAAVSVLLIAFFMKIGADFSRLVFGFGTALALLLLVAWRSAMARIGTVYLGKSPFANLCIYDDVARSDQSGEGAVDAKSHGLSPNPNDPLSVDRLARLAYGMDSVIVHCSPEKRASWAFMLKSLDVPVEIVTPELTALHPLGIRQRSGHTSLVLSIGSMSWQQTALKRAFDLVAVLAILPVLLPVLLLISMLVKLDSPGPALFKQQRIGLGNRPFQILKFRTMRVDQSDENGHISTTRNDQRITRLGQFLRRTSLDEIPQFLNVLLGDMSLVGPRPHARGSRAGDELFWDIDTRYWHRHVVKPGLTGLAQVRGFRGATEMKSDLSNRLQADLEYVSDWSLRNDIRILMQTFTVLLHKNAY